MRVCDICQKGSIVQKSGAHRYGGGWAMRAPKTRRVWQPNLHQKRIKVNGNFKTMLLCTKCLRRAKKNQEKVRDVDTTRLNLIEKTASLSQGAH